MCQCYVFFHAGLKDITVLTCWDSDALDLGRIGIMPQAERLHTNLAKQDGFIQWCYEQSLKMFENDK